MNCSSLSLDIHLESDIEPTLKFNPPPVGFLLSCVEEVLEVCFSFRDIIGIDTSTYIMNAPLTGQAFTIDAAEVHTFIVNFITQNKKAESIIKIFENK